MAADHPYVGEQDVAIALDGAQARGFGQRGIGLAKDRAYSGHIVVRGTPGAIVSATLIWGDGPGDRQTIRLPVLTSSWQTVPLRYVADRKSTRLNSSH